MVGFYLPNFFCRIMGSRPPPPSWKFRQKIWNKFTYTKMLKMLFLHEVRLQMGQIGLKTDLKGLEIVSVPLLQGCEWSERGTDDLHRKEHFCRDDLSNLSIWWMSWLFPRVYFLWRIPSNWDFSCWLVFLRWSISSACACTVDCPTQLICTWSQVICTWIFIFLSQWKS